jgi:hypothetical protein
LLGHPLGPADWQSACQCFDARAGLARLPGYTVVYLGMKQDASFFEGKEPALVYIGKRLKDALRLECIFTEAGVDFGVEADEYRGGVIFRSVRAGAFFYVLPETVERATEVMHQNGYRVYVGQETGLS